MRRSHTISAIKTKQPIVLNLLVNGEGIHTRVRERGENSPFEKEIGAQKYRRLCRPNDIFTNLALGNSIDRKQSIGCKANSTHTHASLHIRYMMTVVAVAARKGGIPYRRPSL